MKKDIKSLNIQEPYRTEYAKAANGKWYYQEYWTVSHIERRQAEPQKQRKSCVIHEN